MNHTNPNDVLTTADAGDSQPRSTWWRLPLLLFLLLVAIVAARWSRQPVRDAQQRELQRPLPVAVAGKTVALEIDFADGRRSEFDAIPWHRGMTVDDLMTAASRLPNGIRYTVGGDGQMTMLASIDGVENQWGGGRNWIYRVNGKLADRSLAVYELEPGDRVLWTFSEKE